MDRTRASWAHSPSWSITTLACQCLTHRKFTVTWITASYHDQAKHLPGCFRPEEDTDPDITRVTTITIILNTEEFLKQTHTHTTQNEILVVDRIPADIRLRQLRSLLCVSPPWWAAPRHISSRRSKINFHDQLYFALGEGADALGRERKFTVMEAMDSLDPEAGEYPGEVAGAGQVR